MQTLPFLAAKTSTVKSAIEPETLKQPNVKGANFNQMLSKQMAQDEAKKVSAKASDQLAQARAKQANTDKNGVEAKTKADVAAGNARQAGENNNDNNSIDKNAVDKSGLDKVAIGENSIDAQLLAQETTAKMVQDATDGKVTLDAQQTEIAKGMNDVQVPNIPLLTIAVAPAIQVSNATETKPELSAIALVDNKALGDIVEKSTAKTKANDDVAQQKTSTATDSQQLENDQFVQTMIAESKMKSGQEAIMSKVLSGVTETSAIATVSIQQPAAKFTTMPLQTGRDNNINIYPGKTGWNEAVSQQVIWMVGATEQTAKLTLNPPELGPLEVIINVKNDKADATFISENPEVRKALEDGLSSLRQLMGQAGVELGQANVNTSKQQQEFQQSNQQQLARQQTANSSSQLEESSNSRQHVVRESNGLVDIFA